MVWTRPPYAWFCVRYGHDAPEGGDDETVAPIRTQSAAQPNHQSPYGLA
jgi:hypothetical protein